MASNPIVRHAVRCALALGSGTALADINEGLLGYWNFDQCAGEDASGNGHHGTINGSPQCVDGSPSQPSKAFNFLGAMEENIQIDGFPEIQRSLSASAWVSPYQLRFDLAPIVTRGDASEAYAFWIGYNYMSLLLNWNSDNELWCSVPVATQDDRFYHVAGVYDYDQGKISLYMNGAYVGGCNYQKELYTQTGPLYIGSSYPGGREYYSGIIDEVRVYNRALSEAEVQSLYTGGTLYALEVAKIGDGTVTSAPAGINCGNDCAENYAAGTKVVLTATPDAHSTFAGWKGACTNTTGTCKVTLSAAKTVTATFKKKPLSNFVVSSVTFRPESLTVGKSFVATIQVKNQGNATADGGYLDVWTDAPNTPTCGAEGNLWATIGTVKAGATKTISVAVRAGRASTKTFRVFADSWCKTTESNEDDNQLVLEYTVK